MTDETSFNRDARHILQLTPARELFPDDFMRAYTSLPSFAEMLHDGGYAKAEEMLNDEATLFVKKKTIFGSFAHMVGWAFVHKHIESSRN